MNERLFLFCIGGTGSRVLRSLTFLLASGVEINAREIVPIIIDPDKDNGDVVRTLNLLNAYRNVRARAKSDKSHFFKTAIEPLAGIGAAGDGAIAQGFVAGINGGTTQGKTFSIFIDYPTLDNETKALMQLLYTEKTNLEADMTVGFKGNPHMGSVVLNQLTDSKDFEYFVSNVTPNDRVFIVSSIFGGTGAAGFPLLVKNIRQPDAKFIGKQAVLQSVPLGAISVLPYFGVTLNPDSAIDKNTFITKTKAALSYYENTMTGLNALYYIGDEMTKDQINADGAANQRNDAHFVEVASALAIIDFMNYTPDELRIGTKYKEYGVQEVKDSNIDFKELGNSSRFKLGQPLIQLFYTWRHWQNRLPTTVNDKACVYTKGNPATSSLPITANLLNSNFFANNLRKICTEFEEWLSQLSTNAVAFAPFNLNTAELQHMLSNVKQKEMGFAFFKNDKWDYKNFDDALNEAEKNMGGLSEEQKLLAIYSQATQAIFNERISDALR